MKPDRNTSITVVSVVQMDQMDLIMQKKTLKPSGPLGFCVTLLLWTFKVGIISHFWAAQKENKCCSNSHLSVQSLPESLADHGGQKLPCKVPPAVG